MKRLLLIFTVLLCLTSCEEIVPITQEELPQTSQMFINQYFEDDVVDIAICEKDFLCKDYKVLLASGFQVKFKGNGTCKEVDCKPLPIPEAIIPSTALEYIKTTFPNNFVVSYELKGCKRFQLELNNDIEIIFDSNGQFIKMDD